MKQIVFSGLLAAAFFATHVAANECQQIKLECIPSHPHTNPEWRVYYLDIDIKKSPTSICTEKVTTTLTNNAVIVYKNMDGFPERSTSKARYDFFYTDRMFVLAHYRDGDELDAPISGTSINRINGKTSGYGSSSSGSPYLEGECHKADSPKF